MVIVTSALIYSVIDALNTLVFRKQGWPSCKNYIIKAAHFSVETAHHKTILLADNIKSLEYLIHWNNYSKTILSLLED
jgi:hypothetical protein